MNIWDILGIDETEDIKKIKKAYAKKVKEVSDDDVVSFQRIKNAYDRAIDRGRGEGALGEKNKKVILKEEEKKKRKAKRVYEYVEEDTNSDYDRDENIYGHMYNFFITSSNAQRDERVNVFLNEIKEIEESSLDNALSIQKEVSQFLIKNFKFIEQKNVKKILNIFNLKSLEDFKVSIYEQEVVEEILDLKKLSFKFIYDNDCSIYETLEYLNIRYEIFKEIKSLKRLKETILKNEEIISKYDDIEMDILKVYIDIKENKFKGSKREEIIKEKMVWVREALKVSDSANLKMLNLYMNIDLKKGVDMESLKGIKSEGGLIFKDTIETLIAKNYFFNGLDREFAQFYKENSDNIPLKEDIRSMIEIVNRKHNNILKKSNKGMVNMFFKKHKILGIVGVILLITSFLGSVIVVLSPIIFSDMSIREDLKIVKHMLNLISALSATMLFVGIKKVRIEE